MDFSPAGRVCSFCGVVGTEDTRFAGGLGAMMCLDCLTSYYGTLSDKVGPQPVAHPPWDEMSDAQLLATLPLIALTADQVDRFLHDWVMLIRERKLSWAHVGKAMGISRQAAWERFGRAAATKTVEAAAGNMSTSRS